MNSRWLRYVLAAVLVAVSAALALRHHRSETVASTPAPQPPPAVRCDLTLSPHGGVPIAQAANARGGRTICLRTGVYTTGEVDLRKPRVTITSASEQRATWHGRVVVQAPGITLERLNLDGSGLGPSSLPSPTINAPDFTLRDADVTNRTGICVHPHAYRGMTPTGFTIERNRIHHCGRLPPTNHDHGIYVADGSGVVRWNAIFDNADRGIQLFPAPHEVDVYGNTITGNGEGVNFGGDASNNIVKDNLITDSRQRWNVEFSDLAGAGNRVIDNCVQANSANTYYRFRGGVAPDIERYLELSGNVQGVARYLDPARGDIRPSLLSSSCSGKDAPPDVAAPFR